MLTVTPNDEATYFTISHPELSGSSENIILQMGLGCATTLSPFDILPGAISGSSFTFTLAQAFPTNTPVRFADGIYLFKIDFDYFDGSDNISKKGSKCILIDYDLKCTIDITNTEKMSIYQSLLYGNDCDSCTCAKMCDMYNYLISKTTTTNDEPCGCN